MNKKLICTLISSCVMAQSLVACNSGSGNNLPEGKAPQKASLTKNLKNGTDNIQGLWGAVTASDSAGKEGKTNFLINNSTDSKFVRLGCTSSGGDMPLTASGRDTIDPYSTLQMMENTNSHMAHYAQGHNGFIQSPLNEQESVLLTIASDGKGHNATSDASELTCYYKLDNGSDEPMYVKLVGHNEGYMVASVGMQEIDKPYNDVQKAVQANSQAAEWIKNGGTASFMAATALEYTRLNLTQLNSFVDKIVRANFSQSVTDKPEDFKQLLIELSDCNKNLNLLFKKFTNTETKSNDAINIYKEVLSKHKNLFSNEEIEKSVMQFQKALTNTLDVVQQDFGDKDVPLIFNLNIKGIDNVKFNISGMSTTKYNATGTIRLSSSHLINLNETDKQFILKFYKKIIDGNTKNILLLNKRETWSQLVIEATKVDSQNLLKYITDVQNTLGEGKLGTTLESRSTVFKLCEVANIETDSIKFNDIWEATQEAKNVTFASKVFGVSEIAELGIGIFGVQALMDLATLPPSVGSYDTSIASFKWMAVTPVDVQQWNATHTNPEQQIKANTQVNAGSSGYNLSTNQNLTLSYNDSATGTDRQKIYSLENTYVDTPFLRASDDYRDDPWFGDVSKGNYRNGNALIQTNINELTGSPDFMQQVQREALKSSGLGSLVVPVISAPTLAGQATLSAINVGVGGQMTNGGLLSAKPVKLLTAKVKTKLGDVEGFIIPENTKLSVPIKVVNNTGFRDMLYSRALTSSYVSNDEGSSVQLSKSMKGYNNLLGLMPTVYSAFTCQAPYAYGSTCNYEVALTRGTTAATKSVGKIYLADAYGEELSVPVFVGYNLILDQQSIETDGSSPVEFVAKVATPDGYTGLSLANLPKGAKIVQGCDRSLAQGDSCTFKLDFSNVEPGEYKLQALGKSTDGDLKDNDIENITVTVTYPW